MASVAIAMASVAIVMASDAIVTASIVIALVSGAIVVIETPTLGGNVICLEVIEIATYMEIVVTIMDLTAAIGAATASTQPTHITVRLGHTAVAAQFPGQN
eukprot:gnl/TRDRNA2_/TRDRNA2_147540_c0_seq1.p2 gnl/TRDRNA2_/TRDRNA2_147540_c0~~gnl/TRDRNA2_/TRDRNA2_147540_c0_seq1.p2  ORF type:complete len:115 (-),score=12.78 gnl/TRDRNA2_/TRDRNA2_147540_c0_seq1:1-303(-)